VEDKLLVMPKNQAPTNAPGAAAPAAAPGATNLSTNLPTPILLNTNIKAPAATPPPATAAPTAK
jgi:hypothetical protein